MQNSLKGHAPKRLTPYVRNDKKITTSSFPKKSQLYN